MMRLADVIVVVLGKELCTGLGYGALVNWADLVKGVTDAVPPGVCPVRVKVALAPTAIEAMVQVTVPFVPTALTDEQLNAGPVFCTIDTKVIVPGRGSLRLTLCAPAGPLLTTSMV